MAIEFKMQDRKTTFLNPFLNFEPSEANCQIRWDPLTNRSGRLAHFVGFKPPPADFSKIIEDSRRNCPFCPERIHEVTPRFSPDAFPEGRLVKGESVLFPNLLPYDEHSALAVLCEQHHVPLTEFKPAILNDALANCISYLNRALPDKTASYGLVTWNYLPAAGSSQVHPHFQVYGTQTPGNFLPTMLAAAEAYHQRHNRIYWEDLLKAETDKGERLIIEMQNSVWLTDFVSLSALTDVIGIFPNKQTLFDLSSADIKEAGKMTAKVLEYFGQQGVYSINMAWMPAVKGRKDYWLQVRISPRMYMAPHVWCTETPSFVYQYQESFMVWSPEDTARGLREFIA